MSSLNLVVGNEIGTQTGLFESVGNAQNGVRLDDAAALNIVSQNRIYDSGANGIVISGTATTTNTLTNNEVSASALNGMQLEHGTHGNRIQSGISNSNSGLGIGLYGSGTSGNLITTTMIVYNALAGIAEGGGAAGNVWGHLSTFDNGGLGIDKDPPLAPSGTYPIVTSVTSLAGVVTVRGKGNPSLVQAYKVELYRVATDPSGFGEGKTFLGEDMTDLNGNWTILFAGPSGCFTALQTVTGPLVGIGASSEFGPNSCRALLPLISR